MAIAVKDLAVKDSIMQLLASCLLATIVTVLPTSVPAAEPNEIHSLESIRSTVEAFVIEQSNDPDMVTVTVAELDRRLRLHQCSNPLDVFWPPSAKAMANTAVGIRCDGEKPWKIYVPVRIALYKNVIVASRSLARLDPLGADDLAIEKRDITRLTQGYVTDLNRFLGYRLKRPVRAGDVITPRIVEAEKQIKRGQNVPLLARVGGLEVTMMGIALSDGAVGDTIKVRNQSSKRVVEGKVTKTGVVMIQL